MDRHRDRGQASLEYVGVVALVAVVMAALTVPLLSGAPLADAVVDGIRRALCLVGGGLCDPDRPCVVRSVRTRTDRHATVLVVRVGQRHVLLREERSDGIVALTLVDEVGGGLDVGAGAGGRVTRDGRATRAGVEADAALLALAGRTTTWLVDPPTAARLTRRLAVGGPAALLRRMSRSDAGVDGVPRPVVTGFQADLEARLALAGAGGGGEVGRGLVIGGARDHRTGRRTVVLSPHHEVAGEVALSSVEVAGAAQRAERYALTLDRDRTPLELVVLTVHELAAGATLPDDLAALARRAGVPASGSRRWETETRLDLTDRASRRVAMPYLAAAVGAEVHPLLHVLRARLRRRIDAVATVDARTYARARTRSATGLGGQFRGAELEAEQEVDEERLRLVAAARREPGGGWRPRSDCLRATT